MSFLRDICLMFSVAALAGCGDAGGTDPEPSDGGGGGDSDSERNGGTDTASDFGEDSDPDAGAAIAEGDLLIQIVEEAPLAFGLVGPDFRTESRYWTRTIEAGPCAYFVASYGTCEADCVYPRECGADNVCYEPRAFVDAGTISVDGLKSSLSIVPTVIGANEFYTDYWDPDPPDGEVFDEGDVITAASDGGPDFPGFDLSVTGVANLASDLACPPTLVTDSPLTIRWTPGDSESRVQLILESGNHASQLDAIVCDTADTGELVVDASILTPYLNSSRPVELWYLSRYRQSSVPVGEAQVVLRAVNSTSCRW